MIDIYLDVVIINIQREKERECVCVRERVRERERKRERDRERERRRDRGREREREGNDYKKILSFFPLQDFMRQGNQQSVGCSFFIDLLASLCPPSLAL